MADTSSCTACTCPRCRRLTMDELREIIRKEALPGPRALARYGSVEAWRNRFRVPSTLTRRGVKPSVDNVFNVIRRHIANGRLFVAKSLCRLLLQHDQFQALFVVGQDADRRLDNGAAHCAIGGGAGDDGLPVRWVGGGEPGKKWDIVSAMERVNAPDYIWHRRPRPDGTMKGGPFDLVVHEHPASFAGLHFITDDEASKPYDERKTVTSYELAERHARERIISAASALMDDATGRA